MIGTSDLLHPMKGIGIKNQEMCNVNNVILYVIFAISPLLMG